MLSAACFNSVSFDLWTARVHSDFGFVQSSAPKESSVFLPPIQKRFPIHISNKSYKRERNISYDRDSLISYWITTWAHCLIFNFWVTKTHRQLGKSNFVSIIKVLKVWRSGLVWTPYSFSYFNNYSYWYFIKANIFFVKVQIKIWIK